MRLIDADIFDAIVNDDGTIDENATETVKNAMLAMPSVDAVPVVRCKDCKYYEEQDETIGTCLLTESGAFIKGYCSWAEVKEE